MSERYKRAAEEFAAIAEEYCRLIDSAESFDRARLATTVYLLLPSLITAAQQLPAVSFDDSEVSGPCRENGWGSDLKAHSDNYGRASGAIKAKFEDWNPYRTMYDPRKMDDETVVGTLADDLADIYADLKKGLASLPDYADAIFTWRLLFQSHWGMHATDALTVLHWYSADAALEE